MMLMRTMLFSFAPRNMGSSGSGVIPVIVLPRQESGQKFQAVTFNRMSLLYNVRNPNTNEDTDNGNQPSKDQ